MKIGKERVVFRCYDYNSEDTDILCISDYLLNVYDNYVVNWTLSTTIYNVESIYIELLSYLINKKEYSKILFSGTSAGGYPSIKYACYFNQVAIISNSQLYLENFGDKNKGDGFYELVEMIGKNNDELLYHEKNIESIIIDNKPKKIIIYNNIDDQTYRRHILPFVEFINSNNLQNICDFKLFKYEGIIPEGKSHHVIFFPNNQEYKDIISQYLLN